jgi:hypothetical protein
VVGSVTSRTKQHHPPTHSSPKHYGATAPGTAFDFFLPAPMCSDFPRCPALSSSAPRFQPLSVDISVQEGLHHCAALNTAGCLAASLALTSLGVRSHPHPTCDIQKVFLILINAPWEASSPLDPHLTPRTSPCEDHI